MGRSTFIRFGALTGVTAAVLGIGCASVLAEARGFAGAWRATWCDPRDKDRECGYFYLYLTQDRDRICGSHYVATLGAARLDEGDLPSVQGTYQGNVATLVITNSRTGSTHLATATRTQDTLQWKMIGTLADGETDEPAIIPLTRTLQRTNEPAALQTLAEIQAAPCRWPDEDGRTASRRSSSTRQAFRA